jgi:hypothetical protein
MPAVAHGLATWAAPDLAHLAACPVCAAAWRVVQAAPRIGDRVAAGLDTTRLADRVRSGLRAQRRAARWKRAGWLAGLAAAAGVALLLWQGGATRSSERARLASGYVLPLAELDGLGAVELEDVLESLDLPFGQGSGIEVPGLSDLDGAQLERLLHSLEG